MANYTKLSDQLLQNTELNLSSRVIYARLEYRMNLSVANDKSFYDSKRHFYYVVYQIKDLMHDCGIGRNAVINSLKQLEQHGFIIKHRLIHLVRLELPKFKNTSNNTNFSEYQAQIEPSKRKSYLKTPKSLKSKPVKKTNTEIKTISNTRINTKKSRQKRTRNAKFRRGINCWVQATNARLHKPELVRIIGQLANKNPKQASHLFRTITIWRKKTLKFFNINYRVGLEDIDGLTNELQHIREYQLDRRVHSIKESNYVGYIVNSLKRFFLGYFYNLKYGNKKDPMNYNEPLTL